MTLAVLFVVVFVGGPLAFRALTRAASGRVLAIATAICALAGMALRYGFEDLWGRHVVLTVLSLALIWFAWIGVLAFGALKLRRVDPGQGMRRWTGVIGAAGTTVPWFGLVSANFLQG